MARPRPTSGCARTWTPCRLGAAAESLTTVLDTARVEDLSLIAAMERLLAIEVAAVAGTPARRAAAVRLAAGALCDRGLRLLRPARRGRETRPRAGLAALPRRRRQRAAHRPARHRQDDDRHRPGPRRGRRRAPGLLHHRRRSGQTLPTRRASKAAGRPRCGSSAAHGCW